MVRIAPAKHTKSDPAQDRSLIDGVQWHHEVSGNFSLLAGCSQHLERHDSSGGIVLPRTGLTTRWLLGGPGSAGWRHCPSGLVLATASTRALALVRLSYVAGLNKKRLR